MQQEQRWSIDDTGASLHDRGVRARGRLIDDRRCDRHNGRRARASLPRARRGRHRLAGAQLRVPVAMGVMMGIEHSERGQIADVPEHQEHDQEREEPTPSSTTMTTRDHREAAYVRGRQAVKPSYRAAGRKK